MNIEIANRLVELRKKHGLSQEELANKLGISRQAVSKWERAESSPDTDNLICLAKLYGVSLDELLDCDKDIDEIAEEKRKDEKEKRKEGTVYRDKNTTVKIENGAIHIVDGDEEVTISGLDGITIDSSEGKFHFGKNNKSNVTINGGKNILNTLDTIYILLVLTSYILLGCFIPSTWGVAWVLFLTIPVVSSLFKAIKKKRIKDFSYPTFVTFIYLGLGMLTTVYPETFNFSWWHPGWVIFITIVIWYEAIKLFTPNKFAPIIVDEAEEPEVDSSEDEE